jgi:SAM-dependent methyltransferase
MREPIPVVLFAYNRPDLLRRTLGCLRENGVPLLYAFSDGAGNPAAETSVMAVRALLRAVDWCELRLIEREQNWGLGRSIRAGVGDVLTHHEAAIVVEDDLICVPGTYAYLCAALHAYRDTPQVMSVTGWNHPRVTPPDVGDRPYLDGRAECWIWGTWARAWRGMEDATALQMIAACKERGVDPWAYGVDLREQAEQEQARNIWAVRWLYHHILHGGLCVRPPWSMVEHIGFDRRASNTPQAMGWDNPPLRAAPPVPSQWPAPHEHPACRRLWAAANSPRSGRVQRILGMARKMVADAAGTWLKQHTSSSSSEYEIVSATAQVSAEGWQAERVALFQEQAYQPLLAAMYDGRPRVDLQVAAEAVRLTGITAPTVLEVGCGSGYYRDVLSHLAGPLHYTGLDFSSAMIRVARRSRAAQWIVGDAAELPLPARSYDIVLNGVSLMHVARYREAIAESRRVSRGWCIFHTVPVLQQHTTTTLRKRAYGEVTVEIIFNQAELLALFQTAGLEVVAVRESIPYNLHDVLGEPTSTRTFVCRVRS